MCTIVTEGMLANYISTLFIIAHIVFTISLTAFKYAYFWMHLFYNPIAG